MKAVVDVVTDGVDIIIMRRGMNKGEGKSEEKNYGYVADEEVSRDIVATPSTFHPPDAEGIAEALVGQERAGRIHPTGILVAGG